ncbi:uncharacterized protein ARMOST_08662 [Armillaria ostoyae]|uniref:Uncharacterized protein n=1 Tax=Armillaria ostoyae TaxID=47428 RepID=A0A284R9B3_ARMOS|nr:uncharacterized protein ARMOST_08662 [Armillaria ostoyae]
MLEPFGPRKLSTRDALESDLRSEAHLWTWPFLIGTLCWVQHNHHRTISFGPILLLSGEQILSHKAETISFTYGSVSRSCQELQDQQLYLKTPIPVLRSSMDLNALNFADIWSLPSCSRVHAVIGKQESNGPILSTDGRGNQATDITMSLHLFAHNGTLRILIAYESGKVALREFVKSDRTTSVEGLGWKVLWKLVNLGVRDRPCQSVYAGDVWTASRSRAPMHCFTTTWDIIMASTLGFRCQLTELLPS